jgi:glycogenin
MNRPDLISTFTKIELWRQTQYRRIVYFDADMVVLRAPNELLKMDTQFAAVPDIGWPDIFNSGMMVLNPNMGDYFSCLALAQRGISFDGADQGLLNMHFREWERLSFTYNCTPSGSYQYAPAYRHFQSSINAVHFIGRDKPWTLGREHRLNYGVYGELLGMWWAVYDRHYRPQSTAYPSEQSRTGSKRVQDYVRGEETIYLPGYSRPPQDAPAVVIHSPRDQPQEQPAAENPLGNAPSTTEQVAQPDFEPTPTVEQRRFSAPHSDWEPARYVCVINLCVC